MASHIERRKFLATLGGVAAAWPLAAHAQQAERMRRIGAFMPGVADDPEYEVRIAAFLQGLGELGWIVGRNVRIDYRWGSPDAERIRKHAAELVALAPDVILAAGTPTVSALQQMTRTVPIVFVGVADPVGGGLVASLAAPGGNTTGFTVYEYGTSVKWLELLKEIDPRVIRAAALRDPVNPASIGLLAAMQGVAPSLRMELSPIDVRNVTEIERAIAAFARSPNSGLIVVGGGAAVVHRDLIVTLAARHKLPAVYSDRIFVAAGGLIFYGPDRVDQFRQAAAYVDRILKGEKPADLPVQAPTKYELVINLKTAKALGLEVPPMLLARADEVIE